MLKSTGLSPQGPSCAVGQFMRQTWKKNAVLTKRGAWRFHIALAASSTMLL